MAYTLYTYPGSHRAMRGLIAAEVAGVEVEVPAFNMGVDNKADWFLKLNPHGKVPTLKTPEGGVFESNAIARYFARMRPDLGFLGRTFAESGAVDSWTCWSHDLEAALDNWVLPTFGYMPANPKVIGKAKEDVKAALAVLEAHLASRTFIVGHGLTLADIAIATSLLYPMKFLMDAAYRKPFPCVVRWFRTVVNQPAVRAVVGDVELATEELAPKAAAGGKKGKKEKKGKKADGGGGGDGGGAGGGGGGGKKAAKKEKKAEEPAAESKEEAPKPKKAGHPLSLLPKSPMVLDAWKKAYSEAGTSYGGNDFYGSMPTFWDMFDSEGYSLWKCTYNYNSENKVGFMTSNLVGGFVQRSEDLRKYAFGVMAIVENEGLFEVSGVWLMRGQEIKYMLEANPDAEYYTWTKIETPLSDADKEMVGHVWCATETLDGKTLFDSKAFK